MEEFTLKILQYGVLGLCAVMLVAAWHIIRTEQKRDGRPRKGIILFTSVFMAFCLLLAVLGAYVQLQERNDSRAAEDKLARIQSAAAPLLNARVSVIESLPEDLPQKPILRTFTTELRNIFNKDETN